MKKGMNKKNGHLVGLRAVNILNVRLSRRENTSDLKVTTRNIAKPFLHFTANNYWNKNLKHFNNFDKSTYEMDKLTS